MTANTLSFQYEFHFKDGVDKKFVLQLSVPNLSLLSQKKTSPASWTELACHQCSNCPLSTSTHTHCPVALNLEDVVKAFSAYPSHEVVEMRIVSREREYRKTISLAEGLSSLLGMYMVTSGCPVMDKLRPMVYTHLPFATADETMYRAISMYLMATFFLHKKGKPCNPDLNDLVKIYEEVRFVNQSFSQRLSTIPSKDANISALVNLDGYALITSTSILDDSLQEIEELFRPYFGDAS